VADSFPYVALAGVLGTGLMRAYWLHRRMTQRLVLAHEFRDQFIRYCNSEGRDGEAYTWLMLNSNRVQSEMGGHGIAATFRPPAANYAIKNYPIILNMVPEIRRLFAQDEFRLFHRMVGEYACMVDEALLRYVGALGDALDESRWRLLNPFIWFRLGVEQLLSVPVLMLRWSGLIGAGVVAAVQGNILFRGLSAAITFIGLISSVVTILLGWSDTVNLVRPYLASWATTSQANTPPTPALPTEQ
jgi:hypothetical protein